MAFLQRGCEQYLYPKNKRWVWTNTAQLDRSFDSSITSACFGRFWATTGCTRAVWFASPETNGQPFQQQWGWAWLTDLSRYLLRRKITCISAFSRLNYNYNEKYYFSANVRQDQYSRFVDPNFRKYFLWFFRRMGNYTRAFWTNAES